MLSIAKLSSAGQASRYYEKDNYYLKDAPEIKESTQWFGLGAKHLNLSGVVDADMFKSLLEGKLPDGTQLGREINSSDNPKKTPIASTKIVHRPGYDLTFSAPKSVSLMALIGEDKAITKAHEKAVEHALTFVEKNAAQTRLMKDKNVVKVKTDNLVVARFQHDTSRELDPQLHTHCVVLNMTSTEKGWRSLSSEKLYDTKMAAGALYRATLAHELQKLGYGIVKKEADGRFEITGIPENVIKHFSKRRQQVEKALEENQQTGPIASAEITLRTRQSKKRIDRETLKQHWNLESTLCNFNFKEFHQKVKAEPAPTPTAEKVEMVAKEAVKFAIHHLSETKSVLDHDNLSHFALNETVGQWVSLKHIERAIHDHLKNGELLAQVENEKSYTTPKLVEKENNVLGNLRKERILYPISRSQEKFDRFLETTTFTPSQTEFAKLVLQTDKPYVVVENFKALEDIDTLKKIGWSAALSNHRVRLFTTSQKNADWFKTKLQLKTSTHSALLATPEKIFHKFKQRQLWFVDKSERLSTHELEGLVNRAAASKAHVVFLTRSSALLSLRAGNTLALLKKADLPTVALRSDELSTKSQKEINALQDSFSTLFSHISQNKHVISHGEKDKRFQMIGEHLLYAPNTCVIALQTEIREQLTQAIRVTKQSAGIISKEEYAVTTWTRTILSDTEKQYARYYKIGQQCQFHIAHPQLPVRKNTPYIIHQIADNTLHLKAPDGKIIKWNPADIVCNKELTVYDKQIRSLAVGDSLRMTETDNWKKWVAGDTFTITHLASDKITLTNKEDKSIVLPVNKPEGHYFDYAYVISPYQLNEHEQNPLLLHVESQSFNITSHRSLLTALSKNSVDLWVATDNSEQLQTKLSRFMPMPALASDHDFKVQENSSAKIEKDANYFTQRIGLDIVECAIEMLSEREAVFSQCDLEQKVMELGTGAASTEQLQQAIQTLITQKELIATEHNGQPAFTTLASLEREQAIVDWVTESANQLLPFHDDSSLIQKLTSCPLTLNPEQKEAVKKIFTTPHQLVGIQGYAGTGKTRLLQAVKYLADDAQTPILGIAPSASAAEQIFMKSGIPSKTLASFLIEAKQPDFTEKYREKPSILIVDESSMVSNRQGLNIKEAVKHLPIHIIAQGDIYQISAIEAGKPFALLQMAGMETVTLKTILRQQKTPTLLNAIYNTVEKKDIPKAWKSLSSSIYDAKKPIVEIILKNTLPSLDTMKSETIYLTKGAQDTLHAGWFEDKNYVQKAFSTHSLAELSKRLPRFPSTSEQSFSIKNDALIKVIAEQCGFPKERLYMSALDALLKEYKNMDMNARKNTLVLTSANEDRVSISNAIRDILKEEGVITGQEIKNRVLVSQNITLSERSLATHYQNGFIIRFNMDNKRLGIEKQSYWQVTGIDTLKNQLALQNGKNKTLTWSPHNGGAREGFIEIYKPENRQLMVGDHIRWRRNDAERGIINAQTATITSIEANTALLSLKNGRALSLDLTQAFNQHFDYAYVSTIHLAQGDEAKNALVFFNSHYKDLHSWRSFYVTISRAVEKLKIFTNDKEAVLKSILENSGDKTSALETLDRLSSTSALKENKTVSKTFEATPSPTHYWDANTVSSALTQQAETVAIQLLGEPKSRTPSALAFGRRKGSLYVTIQGEKQGQWYDFQTGKGGNLLQLIQETHQCHFKEALDMGARLTHLIPGTVPSLPKTLDTAKPTKTAAELSVYQERRRLLAQRYFEKAQPISNTLGERYLETFRGITGPYPDDAIRFHPRLYTEGKYYPAVLFAARNARGDIHAIQAVFLDPKSGTKVAKEELSVTKRTYGPLQGAAVTVQKGTRAGIELYAEGPETALSVARAYPDLTVKTTLGISHLKNIEWSTTTKTVVLCADNDGPAASTGDMVKGIEASLKSLGKETHVVMPSSGHKDFNDIIQKEGIEGVRKTMQLDARLQEPTEKSTSFSPSLLPPVSSQERTKILPAPEKTLGLPTTVSTHKGQPRPALPEIER